MYATPAHVVDSQGMPTEPPAQPIQPDTVSALLRSVEGQLVAEDKRADSLNSRATSLIGFAGIGVTLTASLLTSKVAELSGRTLSVAVACTFAAYASLVATILVVLGAVLFPRAGPVIAMREIRKWPSFEYVRSDKLLIEGRIMTGLISALDIERSRNAHRANWLKVAYALVMVATVMVAALGGIILWHAH